MTSPTAVVRELFQHMEENGELEKGDLLPEITATAASLKMKRHLYEMALWSLVVTGEVDKSDHQWFWGKAPGNVRSKEQLQLITLQAISEGVFNDSEPFPSTRAIAKTFGNTHRVVISALEPLHAQDVLGLQGRGTCVKDGGQERAKELMKLFAFTLLPIEQSIDECMAQLERTTDTLAAHESLHAWRKQHTGSNVTHFLCSCLLCHFGSAVQQTHTTVSFSGIPLERITQGAARCREWLRRNHRISESDSFMLALAK